MILLILIILSHDLSRRWLFWVFLRYLKPLVVSLLVLADLLSGRDTQFVFLARREHGPMLWEDILRVVLIRVALNTINRDALQLVDYVVASILQSATPSAIPCRHHIVQVDPIDGQPRTQSPSDCCTLSLTGHEFPHAHLVVGVAGLGALREATRLEVGWMVHWFHLFDLARVYLRWSLMTRCGLCLRTCRRCRLTCVRLDAR